MHSPTIAFITGLLLSLGTANAFSTSPSDQHKCSLNPLLGRIISRTQHTPTTSFPSSTRLHIFGNLFGGGDDGSDKSKGELASFSNLEKSTADADVAFDSISTYVVDWAKLFEGDGGKERGLTTPVTVSTLNGPVPADGDDDAQDDDNEVLVSSGIKFTFKPPKNAFEDKKDTDDGEKQGKKKKKETSSGGVLVQCQKIASGGGEVEVRLLASRCDIDEGTIIKEMSEQCIVDDLRKAVKIWRDERR